MEHLPGKGGGGGAVYPQPRAGNGGSGVVVVRYQIATTSRQVQKQLAVLLVSMVVKPFIPLRVLVIF